MNHLIPQYDGWNVYLIVYEYSTWLYPEGYIVYYQFPIDCQ